MTATYGLGVDLGTTYTAAALWRGGRAECVPLGTTSLSVPSVLFLRDDDVLLVGDAAVRRGISEPDRVARQFKRRFGDDVPMLIGDREATPVELAGVLLRWVVDTVTEREGGPPAHVTLTHPASWREHRTGLLVEAAETAGLTDVGLVAEPVAAAAFYASTERLDTDALLAVYDLGGGTFDATVVRKTATGFVVQGQPLGDPDLGGADFDQAVMDHVAGVLGAAWRTLDIEDPTVLAALAQVREHAVAAKEQLSADTEASVPVVLPTVVREVRITRGEFETAVRIPILRTLDLLDQAIETAGVTPTEIRTALLVGGSSRIPLISRLVSSQLGLDVGIDAHPKFAVCLGAAILAGARLEAAIHGGEIPAAVRDAAMTPPPAVEEGRPGDVVDVAPPADSGPSADWAPAVVAAEVVEGEAAGVDLVPQPVVVDVDLIRTGITEAVDTHVETEPATAAWTPVVTVRDDPLTIVHTGDRRRGVRVAILAGLLAVAFVAALLVLSVTARAATPASAAGDQPSSSPTEQQQSKVLPHSGVRPP
jgi:actin-like ATPase involved in cell morphogenesis